jgi:DNA-directed RNA polymerase subunit RPC12/RpoP
MSIKDYVESAKAMYDGVKTLIDQDEQLQANQHLHELLSLANTAKFEAMELQDRCSALRREAEQLNQELVKLRNWFEDEKPKYQLHELAPNALVYALKPVEQPSGPTHYLCAHCYNRSIKSILQADGHTGFERKLVCHECGSFVLYRDDRDDFSVMTVGRDRGF